MICSPDSVRAWPVDGTSRGVPALAAPIPIDSVAKQDWNLLRGDLALPVLVLRDERFRHNLRSMRRLVEALGLSLAPHGKTPMAPQLFEEYIREGGAWGVSVATVRRRSCSRHESGHDAAPLRASSLALPCVQC